VAIRVAGGQQRSPIVPSWCGRERCAAGQPIAQPEWRPARPLKWHS
jgi:hypothetical protein